MPEGAELPPTSDEYLEIETSKKHGGWYVWTRSLSLQERAKLMAHELHRGMREQYCFEKSTHANKDQPKSEAPWETMKKRFGM